MSFFLTNIISYHLPDSVYRWWTRLQFSMLSDDLKKESAKRIDYYFRLPKGARLGEDTISVEGFARHTGNSKRRFSTYCYDLNPIVRLFDRNLRFSFVFGDVNYETKEPAFVKTRPIVTEGASSNSVIMRLNSVRHFVFVNDNGRWEDKKDQLVFRNVVEGIPHRMDYLRKTFDNPMCDSGETTNTVSVMPEYAKPYLSMEEMLKFKFIACIEGNDVATNLKWVMSSNSIAVMPRPKIESWFMEATLIPGYHYIEIKDDYSDINEKLSYYLAHPGEAKDIIRHANEYTEKFRNKRLEKWIQVEVAKNYFRQTGQLTD